MQGDPLDDLPCADTKLLVPLKRSAEYRAIRPRVADPHHLDSWQQDGFHLFVFQLRPSDGGPPAEAPVVVFTMHPEYPGPLSAVVVSPSSAGVIEVADLSHPGASYTLPRPEE
jgi:hypothetical protein